MEFEIIFWLKIFFTALLAILVPAYWKYWGPKNFLWFSDIALFGITLALWTESRLLVSMMAVMVLWAEIAWAIDLLASIIFKKPIFGLTGYMFKKEHPLLIRLLSLFHLPLLGSIAYLLTKWNYHPDAVYYQIPLTWLILVLTYAAKPEENINWIYGWGEKPQRKLPPKLHFLALMIFYPFVIMLSAHYLLLWIFT